MSLGASFVSVFEYREGEARLSDDEALQEARGQALASGRPCVFWVSRPVQLHQDHDLPSTVTLSFAPGAYLILYGSLIVRGPLDAGLETRFAQFGRGTLSLLGPMDEIVADWWLPTASGTPVEYALAALFTRYANECLPAPIRLDGPYPLPRPLRIKPPPDPTGGRLSGRIEVRLRGQWARSVDPPTFVAGAGSEASPMSTLISVEDGVVLQIDHVAFDADPIRQGFQAEVCLSMEGSFDASRIEACGFHFASAGVRVRPNVQRWTGGGTASEQALQGMLDDAIELSTARSNSLTLSGCVFTGMTDHARGIDVGFGAPTSLDLRDSQFVGSFANALAIFGGDVTITACQFASETARVVFYDSPQATADVLVRRWGDETEYYEPHLKLKSWPIWQPIFRGHVNVHRGHPLANTHLTITHCTSTSPIFLVMHQTFPYSDSIMGGAVLTNVLHTAHDDGPTSIHLGSAMPPRSLMLQGCRFSGSVLVGPSTVNDVVIELGRTYPGGVEAGFFTFPGHERIEVVDLLRSP